METTLTQPKSRDLEVSAMAENLIGSEILKIAGEVNEKIRKGEKVYNFTVGDFNPEIFPLPNELKAEIIAAYNANQSNYPPADGVLTLRQSVAKYLTNTLGLDFNPQSELLIAGGSRPIIYAAYRAILNPGEYVIYPVPSWNNNHYVHLTGAKAIEIDAYPKNNFMPTAEDIKPHIGKATLIALCSPQNPTGTVFTKEGLTDICNLVIEENKRRGDKKKPVYVLYDQVYWQLTFGDTKHYNPVSLCPEMRDYTIFVDGISKAFAATGVRVGWAMGNKKIIDKMKSIIGHVGAWAPKAEQVAVAKYLDNTVAVNTFMVSFRKELIERLDGFYKGFQQLKKDGFKVDAIVPQAAIYLTVQFNLTGMKTPDGKIITKGEDVMQYILNEASVALVPFYAFGASTDSTWFRLSVGTAETKGIADVFVKLKAALEKLKA
ncbi:MAG TPA: pyridoxal phosphate-dependent aminotransferase [Bacteroidia bacterium]|jgi:aspartate aminotransferase|nr:pyridoxal phosphate-dependent aminotransferase [Bacteroidia bacterium]